MNSSFITSELAKQRVADRLADADGYRLAKSVPVAEGRRAGRRRVSGSVAREMRTT